MAKTYTDLIAEVRSSVSMLSLEELKRKLESQNKPTLVDVREKDEFRAGFIPGAISIPRGFLEMQAEQKLPDKKADIILYCAGGTRSAFAAKTLAELGYEKVASANPGFVRWSPTITTARGRPRWCRSVAKTRLLERKRCAWKATAWRG
jgi:rhodanese-related sulfurtransferase